MSQNSKEEAKLFLNTCRRVFHYPVKSFENHIHGKVFITFIVEKDGGLSDLKVIRGVANDIDAEALRVLKESPNGIPEHKMEEL